MSIIKSNLRHVFLVYLLMIALGVASGLSGIGLLESFGTLVADVFIRIFRCISTPIIALSLIVTLATYAEEGSMRHVWRKTLFYTISTTMVAAFVSCLLYLLIKPASVQHALTEPVQAVSNQTTYAEHLLTLIPDSIFAPFIEHQVMGVLLMGLLIGIAIRHIPDKDARLVVTQFFRGMYGIFFVITKWIVAVLPLGLYGFITVTTMQMNKGINLSGVGEYLTIVVLANLVQGLLVLPLWLKLNGIRPFETMKKMSPALSVAFFSKSSAGTLPVTINTAESALKLNPTISRFVLPLCTSLNMNGCAAFIFATVIYLMQNHGVDINFSTMLLWVLISTIAAIGNAGVPMGCFFLSASLLSSMNVPIILLGVILPFYNLIDMIETALNVWSDTCVATVVNKDYLEQQPDDVGVPAAILR